jgi:hypothetical protein
MYGRIRLTFQGMDRPNTVAGLIDKTAELAALLKFHKAEIRKVTCNLDHLDAAIRLFDPNADLSKVKRYPTAHRAHKGQMRRFVLGPLRNATAPRSGTWRIGMGASPCR